MKRKRKEKEHKNFNFVTCEELLEMLPNKNILVDQDPYMSLNFLLSNTSCLYCKRERIKPVTPFIPDNSDFVLMKNNFTN